MKLGRNGYGRFWTWLLAAFLLGVAPLTAQAEGPLYTLQQRFGVNVAPGFAGLRGFPGSLLDFPGAEALGFGWYADWTVQRDPLRPAGIEFAQLLSTRPWPPDWETIREAAQANPGSLWLIGNEPETRGQGEHTPEEYARIYHEAYTFLKEADPSAQVAIGGVVMPTPLRLEWLDRCLAHYQRTYGRPMPVEVWNIHVQILQEKRYGWGCGIPYGLPQDEGRTYEIVDNCNVDVFKTLIFEFRAWLHARGEGDKPLIISEYGVLMPSSYLPRGDQSVLAFMEGTFDFLLTARDAVLGYSADEGRLVQRWLWFSLNFPFYDQTPGGYNGALYDWQTRELTVFGARYRDYIQRQLLSQRGFLPLVRGGY